MDHPGVHPPTGVALLHVGGARRHVAPGTRGRPHRDRGGNRPGPPHLAGRPGLPLAQAPGRPPSGTRGGGAQPRGNPPTAPRQEGTPLPADGHGPGRPARLRVAVGRRGGATAAGPLGLPVVVSAHGHPGPRHSSRQGCFPAAAPPRRGPAPQPAGGGRLGTVDGRRRALEPLFPPGPGPSAAPRRGNGDRGMGGDRARHGVQVDHSGRPTAHAVAAGVPPPPTDGPLFGPPTRLYEGRVEGHTEPHQRMANEPGCTVPAGTGARTTHGSHTRGPPRPAQGVGSHGAAHRRGAGPGAGALRVLYPQTHIPPAGTSNRLGRLGLQRRVEAAHPGGVVEQWLTLRNPSAAEGHWYLHQLLFLPRAAPEHRRQNPYHTHPERRDAQGLPQPVPPALLPGQGPEALQQGPPLDTATTVQQRGRDGADGAEPYATNCGAVAWMAACRHLARDATGLRQYRPTDRTALASAVAAVTMGPVAAWPAQLLPHVPCRDTQPRRLAATHARTAPLTAEQLYVVAAALLADGGESFVHHHGPAQIAGSIQGPQRDAPDPWHATLRGRTRVWDAGDGTPPPAPRQGEALVLQTAGYQAILHGHAGGYRSHVLAGGRWTVWHSTTRQGAFPPLPHVDWQQGPTQAYYMSADPWPLAVLLHTVSAPNKRQEPGWVNPPALVWSPDQEEHLRAAWQGDAIRATDVPDLHAGPITHARPAATLAVAQRGQQNPQWVVCMFSPADTHIVVCDPERLPGPEAVIRVADCTRMIVKALRKGEHHALLLQANARAARPGVWPAAAHPADLELQLAVPTTVYHWLQAFHDLRWRGKPDRQIGSTHWQTWLQADVQRDAIRGLGPAPATRALDAAAPGRTLAPHTVPLANLPFEPAAEGAIRKSVPLPPARGATEPTKCPLCADKYYTSRGNAGAPGVARGARCGPGGRQGGGLQHPARGGTEVPMARPVRPAPPAPGGRPRRRR